MSLKKNLGLAALFAGVTLGTLHVVNRLFSYMATADNLLSEEKYEFYEWRFGKIAYRKKGSGSPLLLVHNLDVCSSSHEWNNIESDLEKNYTVYSIDLLGCGCSDHPILTYTNFLYVQLITDFIKDVIGEKTDVIVSGDSSSFVLMACANDDSIINRVIMVNPQNPVSLAKMPTKRSKAKRYLICTPIIGTFIYNMNVNKRTISRKFTESYFYDHNMINEKFVFSCFEASHKEKTRSKYLYACKKSRFTNANVVCCMDKLTNSIFVIVGNSNPENVLSANQYQNRLPSIEIVGIDKSKQYPHIERTDEFLQQVQVLLSEEV